ncbi:Superoxide dismutase [Mn] [Buchnera aphidicola (Tuberolachnus salignus)]|uniref:Superoxide dismutase n=1 Tax=Buchnera aphidicola subsp. Tuberolachnus salignus TaxID=98804 RepID=A0A160SYL4_BUCTT|nr:superoxide dismutase [Buchnera aphidicola]CUR53111.1 Superoxide dismutase [Mn] [Buchnera aphidicola (Tuberolachnus salignus)]
MKIINKLPILPYSYDHFEPYIDKKTMELHYTKHHAAYLNNVLLFLKTTIYQDKSLSYILKNFDTLKLLKKDVLKNNLGGHINHCFFWKGLKKNTQISNIFYKEINKQFGNFQNFVEIFEKTAMQHFGAGWVWLIKIKNNLKIISTKNQDYPSFLTDRINMDIIPIIGLDLWEHAYYLNYFNQKIEYVRSFWKIINWDRANKLFLKVSHDSLK